jgi:hypothetical protein
VWSDDFDSNNFSHDFFKAASLFAQHCLMLFASLVIHFPISPTFQDPGQVLHLVGQQHRLRTLATLPWW